MNKLEGLLFSMVITIGIFLVMYIVGNYGTPTPEVEKPMLLLIFESWGDVEDSPNEIAFSNWIYNFGDIEAKNVSIQCETENRDGRVISSEKFNIGNIASNGYEYQSSYTMHYSYNDDLLGGCYLESKDNYINLMDKVNE